MKGEIIMKKIKSIICLLLVLIMMLSLAACGGKGNTDTTKPQGGSNDSNVEGDNPGSNLEPISMRWMACDPENLGRDEVEAEVKRYVKEKLNIDLDIFWYSAADVTGSLSTELTVGEWDVTCVNGPTFKAYADRNLFLPLNEYLEQGYLPTAQEMLPEQAWLASTFKGKTLAVAAYKDLAESWGFILNKSMLDEYGLEVPENWGTLMDFVPTMYEWTEAYRKANPNDQGRQCVEVSQWLPAWFKFEALCGEWNTTLIAANIPGFDDFAGYGEGEAFCPYFTDEYAEYVHTLYKLVQDGIVTTEPGSTTGNNGFYATTCGYIELDPYTWEEFECLWCPAGEPILSTGYVQTNMYVINKNTKDPDRALQFVEMLYSDEYLCTTLKFGIEGMDWVDEDNNGVVEMLPRNEDPLNRFWYDWYGARNSNVIGGKVSNASTEEFVDKLLDLNTNCIVSDNAGFVFDPEPVYNEVAACTNAMAQYVQTLKNPLNITNPDKLIEDFRADLVANGIEAVLDEVQSQLDAWRAEQGK